MYMCMWMEWWPNSLTTWPRFQRLKCTSIIDFTYREVIVSFIGRSIANFANLESFTNFIERKFEPLRCNTHGQHEFAKFIQQIPSKQLFAKI